VTAALQKAVGVGLKPGSAAGPPMGPLLFGRQPLPEIHRLLNRGIDCSESQRVCLGPHTSAPFPLAIENPESKPARPANSTQ